jgi:single-stranded-DNA-specific exonuclease
LPPENLEPFQEKFDAIVKATLSEKDFIPSIAVDAEIFLSDIAPSYYNILTQFAPHGPQNMRPIFMSKAVHDYQAGTYIVKEKHVKFVIEQNGVCIRGIGFNLADKLSLCKQGAFDICYHIEPNDWNGNTNLEIRVLDVRAY